MPHARFVLAVPAALALLAAGAAGAQESGGGAAPAPVLSVELNNAATEGRACRLTFMVENGLGANLGQLALETVILTRDGMVERLTLFDFRDLPAGRPRIRQFDLDGLSCEAVGQVLINGVATCGGEGLEPGACAAGLALSSRVDGVGMIG